MTEDEIRTCDNCEKSYKRKLVYYDVKRNEFTCVRCYIQGTRFRVKEQKKKIEELETKHDNLDQFVTNQVDLNTKGFVTLRKRIENLDERLDSIQFPIGSGCINYLDYTNIDDQKPFYFVCDHRKNFKGACIAEKCPKTEEQRKNVSVKEALEIMKEKPEQHSKDPKILNLICTHKDNYRKDCTIDVCPESKTKDDQCDFKGIVWSIEDGKITSIVKYDEQVKKMTVEQRPEGWNLPKPAKPIHLVYPKCSCSECEPPEEQKPPEYINLCNRCIDTCKTLKTKEFQLVQCKRYKDQTWVEYIKQRDWIFDFFKQAKEIYDQRYKTPLIAVKEAWWQFFKLFYNNERKIKEFLGEEKKKSDFGKLKKTESDLKKLFGDFKPDLVEK